MEYLEPPHIQLGFYWHWLAQEDALVNVFTWLMNRDYKLSPEVTAMRSEGGLPSFNALATHGLPKEDCVTFDDWTSKRVVEQGRWLPVLMRLASRNPEDVDINLGYAAILGGAVQTDTKHAVEVRASGMELNLLENIQAGNLRRSPDGDRELERNARRTDRWYRSTFRAACDELEPDYAARRWEWELQPPDSLIRSYDICDFGDLYLSDAIVPREDIMSELDGYESWSAEPFERGVFISFSDMSAVDEHRLVRDYVCQAVKGWLGL